MRKHTRRIVPVSPMPWGSPEKYRRFPCVKHARPPRSPASDQSRPHDGSSSECRSRRRYRRSHEPSPRRPESRTLRAQNDPDCVSGSSGHHHQARPGVRDLSFPGNHRTVYENAISPHSAAIKAMQLTQGGSCTHLCLARQQLPFDVSSIGPDDRMRSPERAVSLAKTRQRHL